METFATPGLLGADFGDLEMRVLAQHHDETVVEVKSGVSARVALKQLKGYASLFGLTDAQKLQMATVSYGAGGTAQAINRLHRHGRLRHMNLLPARRFWAMAFEDVLGVGHEFYVNAKLDRKNYLEQHYTELASHDTRKGRKAAKVVAKRVMYALEAEEPPTLENRMMRQGSTTRSGRMMGGAFQSIPKSVLDSKIAGKKFDRLFVDELTKFKK